MEISLLGLYYTNSHKRAVSVPRHFAEIVRLQKIASEGGCRGDYVTAISASRIILKFVSHTSSNAEV